MTPSPSEGSSSSRTPSPINSPPHSRYSDAHGRGVSPRNYKGKNRHRYEDSDSDDANGDEAQSYGDQILEYFISDTNQIPQILITPPPDFDPNTAIDDDGHTALHWAAAMGRIRIVKLLLTAGADIFKVNKAGQTALMRSVMFANNYDVRKFPELYELLHRSTLNIDNANRTVFHHIVDVAMSKGKNHAARYYMETVLGRLADYPKELADVINFQDEEGETALTMAARCRSKRLVKLLIDHGADPKIVNNDGKNTEDYILEDERFRMSPGPASRALGMSFRNAQAAYGPGPSYSAQGGGPAYAWAPANGDKAPLHYSAAGQKAATRCVNDMASMLDSLAAAYDQELREKERDTTQAHALLGNIQAEILESQRVVAHLRQQSTGLEPTKNRVKELEDVLMKKMGIRYRLGWEKWIKDEEDRERAVYEAVGGPLTTPMVFLSPPEDPPTLDGYATEVLGLKRKAEAEDVSDLLMLQAEIPQDPESVRMACETLREEISSHRKRRRPAFEETVRRLGDAGTQGKMGEYRRLIGAGCGGVPPGEVDNVLPMLLEVRIWLIVMGKVLKIGQALESEEPASTSSNAWGGAGTKTGMSAG